MKKIVCLSLCLILLFLSNISTVIEASIPFSTKCGENLVWDFNSESKTLTISGEGDMYNFYAVNDLPWSQYIESIQTVVIEEGVTSIGVAAFYEGTSIYDVTIPESVTKIGYYSFYKTAIDGIILPNNLNSIGKYAFSQCRRLKTVLLSDKIEYIGEQAFSLTALTNTIYAGAIDSWAEIDFGDSFGNPAYISKNLYIGSKNYYKESSIMLKNSKRIGGYSFVGFNQLENVIISENTTEIKQAAFYSCSSLKHISVDSKNSYYRDAGGILYNKSMTELICFPPKKTIYSYNIPCTVTSVNDYALSNYSLKSVTIPNSVHTIGKNAFYGCVCLKTLNLGINVSKIGDYAFVDSNLENIYYAGSKEQWNNILLGRLSWDLTDATIHFNSFELFKEKPSSNPIFEIGYDSNCFSHNNDEKDKKAGFVGVTTHQIPYYYFYELTKNSPVVEKNKIINIMENSGWGGSCYGIAASMGLACKGYLNSIEENQYYFMGKPCENEDFLYLIEYFYLTQFVNRFTQKTESYYKETWLDKLLNLKNKGTYESLPEFLEGLVKQIQTDGIVQFSFKAHSYGHSILATGITSDTTGYTIELFDENTVKEDSKEHFSYLKIPLDFSDFECTDEKLNEKLKNFNFLQYYALDNYKIAENSVDNSLFFSENQYYLTVPFDSVFEVTDNNGKTLKYDGEAFSGTMEIENINTTIDTSSENSKISFLISGSPEISYQSFNQSCSLEIFDEDDYVSLKAQNVDSVELCLGSNVSLNGTDINFSVAVGRNKEDGETAFINAETEDNVKISTTLTEEIIVNSTSPLKNINASLANAYTSNTILESNEETNIVISPDASIIPPEPTQPSAQPTEPSTQPSPTQPTSQGVCNHNTSHIINQKDATCTVKGYTGDEVCDICNFVLKTGEVIPKNGHEYEEIPDVPASCCDFGITGRKQCKNCPHKISGTRTPPTNHEGTCEWVVTKEPTSTKTGEKTYVCVACGAALYKEIIPKLDCDVGSDSQLSPEPNTQTQPTQSNSAADKLTTCAHRTIIKNHKPATFFSDGYMGDKVCVKCGVVVKKLGKTNTLRLDLPKFELVKGKKKIKIKYTKGYGENGFQVRYKIKGKWKTKIFKTTQWNGLGDEPTITRTIKNLKPGKYKFQIRKIRKEGAKKAYSSWSKVKRIKI